MTKFGIVNWIFLSALLIFNFIQYEMFCQDVLISILNIFFSFLFFFIIKSFSRNPATLSFYYYILFSNIIYVSFRIKGDYFSIESYKQLALFSNYLLLFFFVGFIMCSFFYRFNNKIKKNECDVNLIAFSSKNIRIIIGMAFFLTILSYFLNLGVMGKEAVELPLKMGGIILQIRMVVIPYLFLLIYVKNKHDDNIKKYLILMFIWSLLETLVMLSKSRIIYTFLPIIIYYILSVKQINKSFLLNILILVFIFFLLYPIIELMRYSDTQNIGSDFMVALENKEDLNNDTPFWLAPYERIFTTGKYYMRALPYIGSCESINFDFSRLNLILSMGGSANYTTHIIDGFSLGVTHSSGTTGIVDSLLIGGYGLCYFTFFILNIFTLYIDRIGNHKLILKVFLILFSFDIIQTKSYTIFMDELVLPFWFTFIFVIYIIVQNTKIYEKK